MYELEGAGERYKLLIAFEAAKEQYRAWLGLEDGTDQALLARLEFHPSHHSWHCHVKPGDTADVVRGVVKESSERITSCRGTDRFDVTQLNAVGIAFRVFNVTVPLEMLQ